MPNPDAPEWADYAWEMHDAQNHDRAMRDEHWNGTSWSERPRKGENVDLEERK